MTVGGKKTGSGKKTARPIKSLEGDKGGQKKTAKEHRTSRRGKGKGQEKTKRGTLKEWNKKKKKGIGSLQFLSKQNGWVTYTIRGQRGERGIS